MQFHENLHDLAVKEGLKGRKLHKAVESFTWNITILKVTPSFFVVGFFIIIYFFKVSQCSEQTSQLGPAIRP